MKPGCAAALLGAALLIPAAAALALRRRARALKSHDRCLTQAFGPPKSAADELEALVIAARERDEVDQADVYGSAEWLNEFEKSVAERLGKEAGLFLPSGTMAQQIVLCCAQKCRLGEARTPALPRERRAFFAHPTSHLLLWEKDAHQRLLGVPAIACGDMARPLAAADVEERVEAAMDAMGGSPPCAVVLEVPHREIGGQQTTLAEIRKLKNVCEEHNLWFHMDGARLWEALPYFSETEGCSAVELCAHFNSVYVSFYKGLGGMTGAMLVGDESFIAEARVWQRRFGGNLFTQLPYALSGLDGLEKLGDSFSDRWATLRQFVAAIKAAAQRVPRAAGLVRFTPDEPQCSLVHCHLRADDTDVLWSAQNATQRETGVSIFHRLRGQSNRFGKGWQYFEWNLGPVNGQDFTPDEVEAAWTDFLSRLVELQRASA